MQRGVGDPLRLLLPRTRPPGVAPLRVTEVVLRQSRAKASDSRLHVLFICSRNQWRSPTSERVWRSHPGLSVRSAGTSTSARRHVSSDDVSWADVIFVMEEKHKERLVAEHAGLLEGKPMHVLDIPDEYRFMDPELVEELQRSVGAILGLE